MTEAEEACPEAEFWDESCAFATIKRMGFSNGPGASFGGEPWRLRSSGVTGRLAASNIVNFVIRDASDRPRFFSVNEPVTLEEFKARCAAIIPASDRAPWVTASISKFGRENT